MPIRSAMAQWGGSLKTGRGQFELGSKSWSAEYSFNKRFQDELGTNPEELLAAAHASCYSMALAAALEQAGHVAKEINTTTRVHIDPLPKGGFAITQIVLEIRAVVPELDKATFANIAEETKVNCPVSKALASVPITLGTIEFAS